MAETLVIGELTLDNSGAVRPVDELEVSLDRGGRSVEQFARRATASQQPLGVLTQRMFSMRSAAIALFGSFTVGGAILALRNLVEEAARGAPAFKELAASSEVFHRNILRMIRDVPGFNSVLHAMSESILVAAAAAKAIGPLGLLGLIAGAPAVGLGPGFIDRFTEALEKLRAEQRAIMNQGKSEWIPFMEQFFRLNESAVMSTNSWARALQDLSDEMLNVMIVWRDVVGEGSRISEESIGNISTRIEEMVAAYEQFGIVASAAFEAVSAAAAAGVISQSAAARIQLAILSIESIMKGKIEVAEAVAAAARYDFGAATLHGIAAGLYFAAAAFFGKGAIFGQSGAGAGGGGAGGAGLGAARTQPPEPRRVIVVTNNFGVTFGFNEAAFARYLKDLERRGERSNA